MVSAHRPLLRQSQATACRHSTALESDCRPPPDSFGFDHVPVPVIEPGVIGVKFGGQRSHHLEVVIRHVFALADQPLPGPQTVEGLDALSSFVLQPQAGIGCGQPIMRIGMIRLRRNNILVVLSGIFVVLGLQAGLAEHDQRGTDRGPFLTSGSSTAIASCDCPASTSAVARAIAIGNDSGARASALRKSTAASR